MSYIDAITRQNQVLVWERNNPKKRTLKRYQAEHFCYIKDDDGEYTSIFNDNLSKKEFSSRADMTAFLKINAEKLNRQKGGVETFESDIPTELRTLSSTYYNVPAPKLNVTFLDIEVDYDKKLGFSTIDNPYAPINAVAMYHNWSNRMVVYAVPPNPETYKGDPEDLNIDTLTKRMNDIAVLPTDSTNEVILCSTEKELLNHLLWEIENSDVLSGWNCIPSTQSVWNAHDILPICKTNNNLISSTVLRRFPTVQKENHIITLANGMSIESSKDHKFPVKSVQPDKYTDLQNSVVRTTDKTVEQLQLSTDENFIELLLRENDNVDVLDVSLEQLYLLGLVYTDGTLANVHTLIYQGNKKRLNLTELSKLSHPQFMMFLSGLLDGDGYRSGNTIEWCNFNGDVDTLQELCLWNGILTTKRPNTLRFVHFNQDELTLLKYSRWENFKFVPIARNSSQKAKDTKFKIFGQVCYVRIKSIESTGQMIDMMDIETSTHYFYTKGAKCHNSDFFDMPYIGMRLLISDGVSIKDVKPKTPITSEADAKAYAAMLNELGSTKFNAMSFERAGKPRWRGITRYGAPAFMLDLAGRVSLDYLGLFRKYEMTERPSYKLESISEEVLPDLSKLEYEGSLADLYNNNFPWFCRYNFRDTEILKGFETKLGYVELANQMVHLSTGLFKHVSGTLKLAELATINFCHHELDMKVNDIDKNVEGGAIKGAFVLIPQVGMHEGIGSVDINSLYPSAIRSINISPETLIGQFAYDIHDAQAIAKGTDEKIILKFDSGDVLQMTAKEWREVLKQEKWAVSGFGTVFDQNEKGIIPAILENWYATRKQYQKKTMDAKQEMEKLLNKYK